MRGGWDPEWTHILTQLSGFALDMNVEKSLGAALS